jgi:HAD superfamily hydrolase (TIGR01509 family)
MNYLLVLDLDGTLISSRDLHYYALNNALENIGKQFIISRDEHLSIYDGLNTTKKLEMLTEKKNLPQNTHKKIWEDKQVATFELIKNIPHNDEIISLFKSVKSRGWKIAVASNSIRETTKLALLSLRVMEYVDLFVSNEDVKRSKPFPSMFWKAMEELNALPKNTIIVEDSHIGRQAALDSGAHLIAVENANSWTNEEIYKKMDEIENKPKKTVPWIDSKLNVVIPMSGSGSRFKEAGFCFPKPLIEVNGKPMIQAVVENLNIKANYIFICQQEHYEKYDLKNLLERISPNCKIVLTNGMTEGAACSILLAKEFIDNNNPLLLANSDQIMEWNSNECLYSFKNDNIDGGILTFTSNHPRWSFVRRDENTGFVIEVKEKEVISDEATTGVYYYSKGSDFVKYAEQMIAANDRVKGEFYTVPVYQYAIDDGKKIKAKQVEAMWGIGIPTDLEYFLKNYKSK